MQPEDYGGKMPPHSESSEQSVIGCLLLENQCWELVSDLAPDDFYRHEHRLIFRALSDLLNAGKPADVVTTAEAMQAAGEADDAGGMPYLIEIARATPTAANVNAYADVVRKHSGTRRLIRAATGIIESAYDGGDVSEIRHAAEQMILQAGGRSPARMISQCVPEYIDELQRRCDSDRDVFGLPTGIKKLDEMTTGFDDGQLVVIAARPSMGKTAFALDTVFRAAERGEHVMVFSLEMPEIELIQRFVAQRGQIPIPAQRKPQMLRDHEWDRINRVAGDIKTLPVTVDCTPGISISDIRARARRANRKQPLRAVMVDYIQLADGVGENRTQRVGDISRGLKNLAKELGCPVLALSQLNRGLEARENKRPRMSDLRESGDIEQDADVILFLYRDEVYNANAQQGVAELIVEKNRNGEKGTAFASFNGPHTLFGNLDREVVVPITKPAPRAGLG